MTTTAPDPRLRPTTGPIDPREWPPPHVQTAAPPEQPTPDPMPSPRHGRLRPGEQDMIVFTGRVNRVEVVNRNGVTDLWFTTDDTVPAPELAGVEVVPAVPGASVTRPAVPQRRPDGSHVTVVRIDVDPDAGFGVEAKFTVRAL